MQTMADADSFRLWVELRSSRGKELLRSLGKLTMPPGALGLQATSVEHKLRLVLHGFYLHVPDEPLGFPLHSLRKLCRDVRSCTSDMGTELGLPDYEAKSLTQVLPEWCLHSGHGECSPAGLEPDVGDLVDEDTETASRVWPRASPVPGILHIIDNAFWI